MRVELNSHSIWLHFHPVLVRFCKQYSYAVPNIDDFVQLKFFYTDEFDKNTTYGTFCQRSMSIEVRPTSYTSEDDFNCNRVMAHELAHWVQALHYGSRWSKEHVAAGTDEKYYSNRFEQEARVASLLYDVLRLSDKLDYDTGLGGPRSTLPTTAALEGWSWADYADYKGYLPHFDWCRRGYWDSEEQQDHLPLQYLLLIFVLLTLKLYRKERGFYGYTYWPTR